MSVSQVDTRIQTTLHRDIYPIVRVSTEFFLRSFDLLGQVHDDVVSGLIVMALWHAELVRADRKTTGIRELARKLDLPYETVRRHIHRLEVSGACLVADGGVAISSAMKSAAHGEGMLRRIYLNAVRLLNDLTRIEVVKFEARPSTSPRSRRLSKEQMAIAIAAIGLLLTCMRELRRVFGDDLVKGLVFTAIRAANVKHYTNTSPAAHRSILPDAHRLPVSVLAISNSLRLPYETVRRHAETLVKEGTCKRVGRSGLMVPESAFRHMTVESITVRKVMLAFVAELRTAGVTV